MFFVTPKWVKDDDEKYGKDKERLSQKVLWKGFCVLVKKQKAGNKASNEAGFFPIMVANKWQEGGGDCK